MFFMVRLSKQARKRHITYKRPKLEGEKSKGSGVRSARSSHANALPQDHAGKAFIPMIS